MLHQHPGLKGIVQIVQKPLVPSTYWYLLDVRIVQVLYGTAKNYKVIIMLTPPIPLPHFYHEKYNKLSCLS